MNIRQSGRRRGRNNNGGGNNRPQGGRGGHDSANRIDSRTRGNAAQMIEKYKNLARDAQLSGDRVQTEYYLQFADHYFRVLSDFRARQEENRPQGQDRWQNREREIEGVENFDGRDDMDMGEPQGHSATGDNYAEDDGDERSDSGRGDSGRRDGGRGDAPRRDGRGNGEYRDNREGRDNRDREPRARTDNRQRDDRGERARQPERAERTERPERAERPERNEDQDEQRPRARRPRRERDAADAGTDGGIDSAVLPPAISRAVDSGESTEAEAAPKARRPRRTLTKPVSEAAAAE